VKLDAALVGFAVFPEVDVLRATDRACGDDREEDAKQEILHGVKGEDILFRGEEVNGDFPVSPCIFHVFREIFVTDL
jgi:hypothetical protein